MNESITFRWECGCQLNDDGETLPCNRNAGLEELHANNDSVEDRDCLIVAYAEGNCVHPGNVGSVYVIQAASIEVLGSVYAITQVMDGDDTNTIYLPVNTTAYLRVRSNKP